ncbi:hypothetical protein SAMN02745181_0135 [Rubritalea squalenifaciens DSM 18772]|uniref:Uncharacterized protein n=1 Tax=Rubritalea squalenifaciens DSM 18772 TaxID=1123071 RepID=A0A1M6B7F3_9BACT|nr:hypothetical protein SAMN02745181_0135 [Rubritalea squalenifaciens DSM 18772]
MLEENLAIRSLDTVNSLGSNGEVMRQESLLFFLTLLFCFCLLLFAFGHKL